MARPPKDRAQSEMLRFRVLPEVSEFIQRAAQHAAKRRGTGTVSDWLREVLVKAAEKELGEKLG